VRACVRACVCVCVSVCVCVCVCSSPSSNQDRGWSSECAGFQWYVHTATHYCKTLQQTTATYFNALLQCNTLLQHTATHHCNTLPHTTALHCNTPLQHTATQYCNTPQGSTDCTHSLSHTHKRTPTCSLCRALSLSHPNTHTYTSHEQYQRARNDRNIHATQTWYCMQATRKSYCIHATWIKYCHSTQIWYMNSIVSKLWTKHKSVIFLQTFQSKTAKVVPTTKTNKSKQWKKTRS